MKAVENVSNCDVGGEQLGGVDRNVKLGLLSALHQHRGNTVQPIQPRFHLVGGSFPELGLRYGIGREAVAHDGEAGERHSVRNHSGGWRQFSLNPRDRCIYVLQRLEHVYIPIKKQIDFRRTATGNGTNFRQPRNAVHRFLNRAGDGDHHLINRHYAVVDGDQDSRKIGFWENRDWNGKGKISSKQRQRQDQKDHGFGVPRKPVSGFSIHCARFVALHPAPPVQH